MIVTDERFLTDRRVTDRAVEIIPVQGYRSPAWHQARLQAVSASEIAAVLGLSPYQSRFDLWWAKRNGELGTPDNPAMRRGRRVEPLVVEDFLESHTDYNVTHVGLCANVLRRWQVCTPDGLVTNSPSSLMQKWRAGETYDPGVIAVLEAKTSARRDGWGDEGTDQIPIHYRAQVQWQMDVLGLDVAFVGAWIGYDYREFVVSYDAADAAFMREEARSFLTSLQDDTPPEVDAHPATLARLKALHPVLIDGTTEVAPTVVAQWHTAQRLETAARERRLLAEARLRSAMGDCATATVNGRKVASRSVYNVKESLQHRRAHTVDRLNVTKPNTPKGQA